MKRGVVIVLFVSLLLFAIIRLVISSNDLPDLVHPKWLLPPGRKYRVDSQAPSTLATTPSRIPRILHQTSKENELELQVYETCIINREMNHEYDYRFYNDDDIRQFVKTYFPERVKAFNSVIPGAYRADLFRYMVLYIHGGVYMDCKSSTIVPLRQFLPPDASMATFRDRVRGTIQISFLAAEPRHPVIERSLQIAFQRIDRREYGDNMLDITGPQVCGRALNELEGRPSKQPIEVGRYPQTNSIVLGSMQIDEQTNDEILNDGNNQPLISRGCGSYYKNRVKLVNMWDQYSVRWLTGRVYSET